MGLTVVSESFVLSKNSLLRRQIRFHNVKFNVLSFLLSTLHIYDLICKFANNK